MVDSQWPVLLFYCQHSLGIGHLTRSFALADALKQRFRVVFLNGGRLPPGVRQPEGITLIDLPALGMDDGHTLVSRQGMPDVASVQAHRRQQLLDAVTLHQPALLLVELFPFGRKKFANEILPMIRQARRQGARVACSLRDILVDARPDQQHHDDRARWLTDRYFDMVLVHADRDLAPIEASFRPSKPLRTPLHYTGYVVPQRPPSVPDARGAHLLVSAGGGMVGEGLFTLALAAQKLMRHAMPLRLVAGPFLPEQAWRALQAEAKGRQGVECVRQVPDMVAEMRMAKASLSQCGYNTALDVVVAGVPALVVPYATATENEQAARARRLGARGALRWVDPGLDETALASALDDLMTFEPTPAAIDLDGARQTADWLLALV